MPECYPCDRWFNSEQALEQHLENSSAHNYCSSCERDFASSGALEQHYSQSKRHAYCRECEEHFGDFEDLYEHYADEHIWCESCHKLFACEVGLHEHRRQVHADRYCPSCERMFQQPSNLHSHLRSSVHQSADIACPMRGCSKSFISRAALVIHLESGGCASGIDRRLVDKIAHKLDRHGTITDPARMLEYGQGGVEVTDQWATAHAWNGDAFECYLCAREFQTLDSLNQHLRSPAHAKDKYRCPTMWKGCEGQFKTLSGFLQHIESEACGAWRFKGNMDRMIDGLSSKMKRITV
ncbi:uncharacterized protein BXZ73DRAFT_106010 [Epithele typhae]|uniref:uncharacterized protein n=1 Tax=Epithele typhae TaxID=378194 RepID=UPI0020082331|nr:uncharacterized protein BXZ73DRAFT_106010 [Epithele typhae]KAH9915944.1 hypothetical protein BXZ73DRAFT_106010 [Epithele typhae]